MMRIRTPPGYLVATLLPSMACCLEVVVGG